MPRITYSDGLTWASGIALANEFASRFLALKNNGNKAITNEGAWNGSTNYFTNDLVTYSGTDYRALADSLNVTPGSDDTKWKALGGDSGSSEAPAISTKYHYSGNSVDTLTGPAGSATLTPGDGQVATKNRLVTATGADFADITLTNFTSDAGTGGAGIISTGGTASSSNIPPGDSNSYADKAFDGDTEALYACWWSSTIPSSLKYDLGDGNGKAATGYKIWPRSGNFGGSPVPYNQYAPKTWTFEGSVDGSTGWVVLDTQTNVTGWADNTPKTFSFSNSTIYRAYRLVVTLAKADGNVMIGEMQITGLTTPGTLTFDAEFADGVNYPLSVSAGTLGRTQDGNVGPQAMGYQSGVELRGQTDGLALRVTALENTPSPATPFSDIIEINGPQSTLENGANYAVNTSSGAFTQDIPTAGGKSGSSIRFTKISSDSNSFTMNFLGPEIDMALAMEGDTITIQAYPVIDEWVIVHRYPTGDVSE